MTYNFTGAFGHTTVPMSLPSRTVPGRRAAPGACTSTLPVHFALVTTPTTFLAGDRLMVTVVLACAKGCETFMRGQLYYGADTPSSLAFDATPGSA